MTGPDTHATTVREALDFVPHRVEGWKERYRPALAALDALEARAEAAEAALREADAELDRTRDREFRAQEATARAEAETTRLRERVTTLETALEQLAMFDHPVDGIARAALADIPDYDETNLSDRECAR